MQHIFCWPLIDAVGVSWDGRTEVLCGKCVGSYVADG